LQLKNTDSDILDEASYYEVIRKKTASLFSTCGKIGAKLGGGSVKEIDILQKFGDCVGICFQLRDDIFDYDKVHDVGKPAGNDMKEGKLTLPVIHAILNEGGDAEKALAFKVRKGTASDEEITLLVDFAKAHGGIDYAVSQMHECCDQAIALLENNRDPEISESLKAYVNFVADRSI